MREFIEVVLPSILIIVVAFGLAIWGSKVSCESRWEMSGMKTSWGVMQGCLVKLPDGRWMPEKSLREINVK